MMKCKSCNSDTDFTCGKCEDTVCLNCLNSLMCDNCLLIEEISLEYNLISNRIEKPLKFLRSKLYNDEHTLLDTLIESINNDNDVYNKSLETMKMLITPEAMNLLQSIIDVCKFVPNISLDFDDKMCVRFDMSINGFKVS